MTLSARIRAAAALVAVAALGVTGCSAQPGDGGSGDGGGDGTFPVTIEHAFGETTIDAEPERVVAWGWASADAAIALGVMPVGIPAESYAGDEEGVLPWIREAVEEQGAEMPTVLANGEEPPYEDIAELAPDLILAPYSGLTEDQYDLLSEIAPVVAYPEEPWATPWRDIITIAGEALGRSDEAEAVLDDIDGRIAEAAAEHPEFAGKTIAAVWDVSGSFYVYKDEDPRVQFLLDLGFESAPAVDELDTGEATFYYTLSYEQLDKLQSDVLLSYASTQEEQDAFLNSSYAQLLPAVQSGAVASLVGTEYISAVSPPTALSLTWGLDQVVAALAEATAE
jgi:iron complex transport system substrate-binding protein